MKLKHRFVSVDGVGSCSCGLWQSAAVHTSCTRAQLRKRLGPFRELLSAGLDFRPVRREEALMDWGQHALSEGKEE
jgi:hypothetical protein